MSDLDNSLVKTLRLSERIYEHSRSRRPKMLSAKKCSICENKQRRSTRVEGPFHENDKVDDKIRVKDLRKEFPQNSDKSVWKSFGLGSLVCPPSYKEPDKWFVVEIRASCPKCDVADAVGTVLLNVAPFHPEKFYRRKYGQFGLLVLKFKSTRFGSFLFGLHVFTERKVDTD